MVREIDRSALAEALFSKAPPLLVEALPHRNFELGGYISPPPVPCRLTNWRGLRRYWRIEGRRSLSIAAISLAAIPTRRPNFSPATAIATSPFTQEAKTGPKPA